MGRTMLRVDRLALLAAVALCALAICIAIGSSAALAAAATVPASSALPDGRVYEQVSTPGGGEVYVPSPTPGAGNEQDIGTELPFRPSDDGNRVVYLGDPPSSGIEGSGSQGSTLGNEYMASRSPDGWSVSDVTPSGGWFSDSYRNFSSDLSIGVVGSFDRTPLFPGRTSDVNENLAMFKCLVLYTVTTEGGIYKSLFHTTQTPHECGESLFAGANEGTASVARYSHLLFQTPAALTSQVTSPGEEDLYDSVGGQPISVDVLPNGTFAQNAYFGGLSYASFSNVISADGARIFWTDRASGTVYVRENDTQPQSPLGSGEECTVPTDACTVQVSAGSAQYLTATKDGRYAFYAEAGRLWRFDVQSQIREPLTIASAEVQGLVGMNETGEDGAYVYFVADGVLSGGQQNAEGDAAVGGQPNLYLYRPGHPEPTFVATLSPGDDELEPYVAGFGDWQANQGDRTAEVSPDGRTLGFVSKQSITGYDNLEVLPSESTRQAPEVYVYDASSEVISCASCAPDGEPPVHEGAFRETGVQASSQPTYMTRWISDDGNRVFFDSPQPLVPQDVSQLMDVYEWERDGVGSCRQSAGCVYLLSGGNGNDFSYFVGASADGADVFFTHRGRLGTKEAGGDEMQLYDARVDGGFPEISTACTGTGCQGVPPAPPIFATPSSVTFDGVGNFAALVVSEAKAKSKKPAKCKRGFSRKRGKCVRVKSKRAKVRKAGSGRRGKK